MDIDSKILKQIEDFSLNLKLSQSVKYLYNGNYKIADTLLLEMIDNFIENPLVLNFYAISLSQQSRFQEAEMFWQKALAIQPDNIHFQKALKKNLSFKNNRIIGLCYILNYLKPIYILTLIIAVFFIGYQIGEFNQNIIKNFIPNKEIINKSNNKFDEVIKNIKNIKGTIVSQSESALILKFAEGLFIRGTLLRTDSKKIISDLGKILESHEGDIYIYGCTDDIPVHPRSRYSNNISLSIARAKAVLELLRHNSNISSNKIYLGNLTGNQCPYPNSSIEGKSKNRTVIIKLLSKNMNKL